MANLRCRRSPAYRSIGSDGGRRMSPLGEHGGCPARQTRFGTASIMKLFTAVGYSTANAGQVARPVVVAEDRWNRGASSRSRPEEEGALMSDPQSPPAPLKESSRSFGLHPTHHAAILPTYPPGDRCYVLTGVVPLRLRGTL